MGNDGHTYRRGDLCHQFEIDPTPGTLTVDSCYKYLSGT